MTAHAQALAARPVNWWHHAVVYQVYPRSFADSDGDGYGDIRGVISKLDYLHALGVDVVWLSPVYRSPQDDNGYDISDYQDIDPLFGSLADLDDLIAGLHERGMKLVMDLVVNHTSDEHPWFVESREPDSPKRDWYWWRPPRPGMTGGEPGAEPTNWGSAFSGSAWEYDPASGEYYLHLFSRKQPDLNWENPEVRRAVYAMMRWWVARGVDGFRMDVINFVSKPHGLPDGPVAPGMRYSYEVGLLADGPRMHDFLHEMYVNALGGENLLTVGEMPLVSVEEAALYTDPRREELAMVFQFEHMGLDQGDGGLGKFSSRPLHLPDLKASVARWQRGLEAGWNSLYWNNHDQPRIVSRWGDDSPEFREVSAKTLATVLHLQKGTPYIYQGEEFAMTNASFARIEEYRDIESLNFFAEARAAGVPEEALLAGLREKSRDNARTPMCWTDGPHGGFTTGTPWIEVNANAGEVNAAAAVADPDSVFHHYRRLIELRHRLEIVRHGVFDLLLPDHEQLFCFTRTLGSSVVLVVANMSSRDAALPTGLPDAAGAEVLLSTHTDEAPGVLRAWESRVVRLS